jgi:hypothetical protein
LISYSKNIINDNSTSAGSNYNIIKESYTEKNIKISYPQIANLSDQSKQKILNEKIKESAYGSLKNLSEEDKDNLDINLDYQITLKTDDLLSLFYSGSTYCKGANHPNAEFYTTNIDIENEKVLRLTELINIDENFVLKFRNAKMISPKNKQKDIVLSPPFDNSNQEWIERFRSADSKGSGTQDYSYLTKDSLIISVPVAHVFGDHAEFEIKYRDLKDNINTKNQIWKDLVH